MCRTHVPGASRAAEDNEIRTILKKKIVVIFIKICQDNYKDYTSFAPYIYGMNRKLQSVYDSILTQLEIGQK